MSMFLVLNTSCIQFIPATIIALRASFGSKNPAEVIGTIWVASICAFITESLLQKHCHIFSKANPRLKRDSRTKRDGGEHEFYKRTVFLCIPALILLSCLPGYTRV